MKKTFIPILGILISINAYGQEPLTSQDWLNRTVIINKETGAQTFGTMGNVEHTNTPENTEEDIFPLLWQRTYSKNTLDHGRYAQKAIDNGYILAGRTLMSGEMDFDGWIIRTDYQGEVIWEKNFGDYYVDELEVIKTTTDNAYIAIGTSTMFGNSGEGWVIKVDDEGEIIWNKGFHPPLSTGWDFLYDVIELEDGSYVAVGWGNSSSTSIQAWIIKISNSGEVIWNHEFGGSYWERLTSVKQTSDGGFIAAGDKHVEYGNIVDHDGYLVKFNSEGEIEWEKTYGPENNQILRRININTDGTFTVTGSKTIGGSEKAWVMKTDAEGNEIYSTLIDVGNITEVIQLEDGNELICANSNYQSVLVLIDSEGNVLNEQYFSIGDIDDRATSLQITETGHVILGGRANAHTQGGDFWLVTMGEENTMNVNEFTRNEVSIYPNPANDKLNVQSNWFIDKIRIFDLNGKLILDQNTGKQKKEILNIENIPSGVYLVEITSGNQKQIKNLIVK